MTEQEKSELIEMQQYQPQENPFQTAWNKTVNNLAYNQAIDECLKEFSQVWDIIGHEYEDVAKSYEATLLKMKK